MGVVLGDVSAEEGEPRARLMSVLPDSPAARAGLREGDSVLALDGVAVPDSAGLTRALALRRPGDDVVLRVEGDDGRREVKVTLGDRSEARARLVSPDALGLEIVTLGPELAAFLGMDASASGVVVRSVDAGKAAAIAGLRRGDVIVASAGTPVRDADELRAVLAAAKGTVPLDVRRGDETVPVTLTVPDEATLSPGR